MGNCITFCFCSACASLLSSCCGSDKDSTTPPSATSGRMRSVFLLLLSIGIAFSFQYGVAPELQPNTNNKIQYLEDAWSNGCKDYNDETLQLQCSGHSGVYRAASSAFLFFTLAAIAAWCKPTANRDAWPAKIFLFLVLNVATIFVPNEPIFSLIMVNVFRVGAAFFILFQQVIFIDVAYNLNESWVEKANKAEAEEGEGAGKKWLYSLLTLCLFLFVGSFIVIGLFYGYFTGCNTHLAFITVTLALGLICTAVQLLFSDEGSLLTSATIFSYATYLCYVAMSQNPDGNCNPTLVQNDTTGIVFGIGLTILSLFWTGWSYTAHKTVRESGDAANEENDVEDQKDGTVKGLVVRSNSYGSLASKEDEENATDSFSSSWKLNVILILITCWYAVVLTGWGSVEVGGNSANPSVGRVSMWIVVSSQWLVQSLYLWTLAAPGLFPDRDFS